MDTSSWMILLKTKLSSSELRIAFLALGVIAAAAVYYYIWNKYRNTDKSYEFESTTSVDINNVQGSDDYCGSISRTRETEVANHELSANPRRRLQRPY
ncbi:MAG: hypothetical protein HG425_007305 [Propionibacterium sp.]|jgi:hypothetical protein|nr:hypothetical protein [Propionibacterium sp.]MDO4644841.1 hypothetical protein [Propionibacteriaceae bacterium]